MVVQAHQLASGRNFYYSPDSSNPGILPQIELALFKRGIEIDDESILEKLKSTTLYILYRSPSPTAWSELENSVNDLNKIGGDIRLLRYQGEPTEESIYALVASSSSEKKREHSAFILNTELFSEAARIMSELQIKLLTLYYNETGNVRAQLMDDDSLELRREYEQRITNEITQSEDFKTYSPLKKLLIQSLPTLTSISLLGDSAGFKPRQDPDKGDINQDVNAYTELLANHILPLLRNAPVGKQFEIKIVQPFLFDHEVPVVYDDDVSKYHSLRSEQYELTKDTPEYNEITKEIARVDSLLIANESEATGLLVQNLEVILESEGYKIPIAIVASLDELDELVSQEGVEDKPLTLYVLDRHVVKYRTGGYWDASSSKSSNFLRSCPSYEGNYDTEESDTFNGCDPTNVSDQVTQKFTRNFLSVSADEAQKISDRIASTSGALIIPLTEHEGWYHYKEQLGVFNNSLEELPTGPTPVMEIIFALSKSLHSYYVY